MGRDNVPGGRFWEPEDDRSEEELIAAYEQEEHEPEEELPFD